MRKYSSAYGYALALTVLILLCDVKHCAIAQARGNPTPGSQELRVRVLDEKHLGVRGLIKLSAAGSPELIAYTDWSGNASFQQLAPGDYALVISFQDRDVYRSRLSLQSTQRFRYEEVRLRNVTATDYTRAVTVNDLGLPTNARKFYFEGVTGIRTGDLDNALKFLDKAIAICPRHAKSHNARGVALHMAQRATEAEIAFRNAIRFDPAFVEPRINLGNLFLEQNKAPEAEVVLQSAAELDRDNPVIVELIVESTVKTHDEVSAVLLVRALHQRSVKHPASIHLQLASEFKKHGIVAMAAEQYSLALKDDLSSLERSETEQELLRTQN